MDDEPVFLDVDGVRLVAGDCAHIKRRAAIWVRVWVREVRLSRCGERLPEARVDNGERWDADGAARTATFLEIVDDSKRIRRAARATEARDIVAELRAEVEAHATALAGWPSAAAEMVRAAIRAERHAILKHLEARSVAADEERVRLSSHRGSRAGELAAIQSALAQVADEIEAGDHIRAAGVSDG